jgi:hypothetical protein
MKDEGELPLERLLLREVSPALGFVLAAFTVVALSSPLL